jgi:uncharacterized protein YcnI
MKRTLIIAGIAGALAVPAASQGHVTVQPPTAVPGGFTVQNIRVPNEEESANTTKIEVKLPPGYPEVAAQPVPGWKVSFTKSKLNPPAQTDDGPVTEQVSTVTWSGGKLPPEAFQDFPLEVQIPDGKVGSKLTFKAVQTYDDGKTVSWIGSPGSDTPAPQVTLIADPAKVAAAPGAATTVVKEKSGDSKTLATIALIVGALGLLVGIGGVASARRSS